MNPANHGSEDEPNPEQEKSAESAAQYPAQDGAKDALAAKNPAGQKTAIPKVASLREHVRKILQTKAHDSAGSLKSAALESKVNETIESIISKRMIKLHKEACNYMLKSAAACKITKEHLTAEFIRINKLEQSKRTRRAKGDDKRDAKNRKGGPDAS